MAAAKVCTASMQLVARVGDYLCRGWGVRDGVGAKLMWRVRVAEANVCLVVGIREHGDKEEPRKAACGELKYLHQVL